MNRCHVCRDDLEPNEGTVGKNARSRTCARCTDLLRAPPCRGCGKPVRTSGRSDPEPYHEMCRRCNSCYQVIPKEDIVKLAGYMLCTSCDHLFGKFFLPKHRSQADRMKEAFQAWDVDGSGSIEVAELRRVMRALDPDFADRDLSKLFRLIDTNRSGVIEYDEFCQWIMKGMPLDVDEESFEDFITGLMRSAGAAAQQAEMEIVEVQLRPDGLLFVRKCGEETFATRALTSPEVRLTRIDPEEFIFKVENTEAGLVLMMNTGRTAVVPSQGALFGAWQAPEGFHIVGLRTKPSDATKGLPASAPAGTGASWKPGTRRAQTVFSPTSFLDPHRAAKTSADDSRLGMRPKTVTAPMSPSKAANLGFEGKDTVVGVDLAPLCGARSYDAAAALRFAAEHDFLYTLQQILAKAAVDLNAFGPGGVTALMLAAQHGNIGALRLLLGSKANPLIADPDGWTALTFASRCGQTTCVQILLEKGVTLEGDNGAALREALRHQHNSAARALLRAGVLPMAKGTFALEDPLDTSKFKLEAPVFQPAGSVYSVPVTVELLAGKAAEAEDGKEEQEEEEEGAEQEAAGEKCKAKKRTRFADETPVQIYYTLDGLDPFDVRRRYRGPITLTAPRTQVRAVAVRGDQRSVVVDQVYVVCHYAMPDEVVSGELKARAFPEVADCLAQALGKTIAEPLERVRTSTEEVEGGSRCWLRFPLCDPRPRHALFIDRSFATVRGAAKTKDFIEKFKGDVLQATSQAPGDIEVSADLRAGRSTHKAGSIAVEFTLARELAEQVRQQLQDGASCLLGKSKLKSFLCDATLEVVEPLSDRVSSTEFSRKLRADLGKRVQIEDVIGFGSTQEGMVAICLQRPELKKIKDRSIFTKALQAGLPNIQVGEAREGPDELDVEFTVDVIGSSGEDPRDASSIVKELNEDDFSARLMMELARQNLPLEVAMSSRATARELSQLEFRVEWQFPASQAQSTRRDFLDCICMIYCGGSLGQVIDFRSAHEDRHVHDGMETEEAAALCRSIQRAVKHSGDITSDAGGEHRMALDLDALPPSVSDLFFVLAAFECKDISLFNEPCLQIHDVVAGRDLTSYRVGVTDHSQAVVMCSFTKDPDHGKWVVHGLGHQTDGSTKDYEPIKRTIAQRCQGTYSRWDRRQDLVKLRVLHKCGRLTALSSSKFAQFLWQILVLPVSIFQVVILLL